MRRLATLSFLTLLGVLLPVAVAHAAEECAITGVEDTIAGYSAEISVSGPPERTCIVRVMAPKGGVSHRSSVTTDEAGKALLTFTKTNTAGTYEVEIVTESEAVGGDDEAGNSQDEVTEGPGGSKEKANAVFEVFAGTLAKISLQKKTFEIGENSLCVLATDRDDNPLLGRPVLFFDAEGKRLGKQVETDEEGVGCLTVKIPKGATATHVTVTDVLSGEEREFPISVASASGEEEPPPLLGAAPKPSALRASLLDEFAKEDAGEDEEPEARYAESFRITVRDERGEERKVVPVNTPLSLEVTALDRNGAVATDYAGDVVVEAPFALVPSKPLRFLPSSRGVLRNDVATRRADLALLFTSPGTHTVHVEDQDDPEVTGELTLHVVGKDRPLGQGVIAVSSPRENEAIPAHALTVKGSAGPYINLDLFVDGALVVSGDSGGDGTFTFNNIPLDPAQTSFIVEVQEQPGGAGLRSMPIHITVDKTAPEIRDVLLLPQTVAPGAPFTVSVKAEQGQGVTVAVGEGAPVRSLEGAETGEGERTYQATLTAPDAAGTYPVQVVLRDGAGREGRETRTLTVMATGLSVVEGLKALPEGMDIQLSWIPVAGAAGYRVYVGKTPEDLSRSRDTFSATPGARITGLRAGEMYAFAVTALGEGGLESAAKSGVVTTETAGSLFHLRATPLINGSHLTFEPPQNSDVLAYRVRYGVQAGMPVEQRLLPGSAREADIPDLINGLTYYVSLGALRRDETLLADAVEIEVTPGEGGKPGILVTGAEAPLALSLLPRESHAAAPPHASSGQAPPNAPRMPRSGIPLVAVGAAVAAAMMLVPLMCFLKARCFAFSKVGRTPAFSRAIIRHRVPIVSS